MYNSRAYSNNKVLFLNKKLYFVYQIKCLSCALLKSLTSGNYPYTSEEGLLHDNHQKFCVELYSHRHNDGTSDHTCGSTHRAAQRVLAWRIGVAS